MRIPTTCVLIVTILTLCACASTPPVQISPGTYYASKTNTAGMFGSVSAVAGDLMVEGNKFCASKGMDFDLVSESTQNPIIATRLGGASITFRCVPHGVHSSNNESNHGSSVSVDFGTAFAVDAPNIFVTARHVVEDATDNISLSCPGGQIGNAKVTAVDIDNDLAVLRSTVSAQAFLSLAPDNSVSLGNRVFTVGFPVPGLLGLDPKYSDGVVSSLTGIEDTRNLMQITIPIQPGNSGGAVADAQGRVVGVVVSSAAIPFFAHYTGTLPQNVNFAVRSYYIRPLLNGTEIQLSKTLSKLTPIERVTASTCLVEAR